MRFSIQKTASRPPRSCGGGGDGVGDEGGGGDAGGGDTDGDERGVGLGAVVAAGWRWIQQLMAWCTLACTSALERRLCSCATSIESS